MDATVTHVTEPGPERGPGGRCDPGDIPNYELLAFINGGGFGDVWLARERVTGVRRAVKVLYKSEPSRAAREIEGVRRYQRCTHNHPHLLQILTVGETERCFYYVMEAADDAGQGTGGETGLSHRQQRLPAASDLSSPQRVACGDLPAVAGARRGPAARDPTPDTEVRRYSADGAAYVPTTLRTLMQTRGSMNGRSALEVLRRLTSAVARLHDQSLAHHDLKPENILIVDGEPKIADVGLVAPREQPPQHAGTPLYMTPQGQADDLCALGKVLYELISGRPATDFPRLPAELVQQATPELAAAVQIANRACHSQPARRFASVLELQRALATALRRQRSVRARWRRLSRRGKLLAGTLVVAGACAAALLADAIHARVVPRVRYERELPLSVDKWSLVSEPGPVPGEHHYPYVRLDGTPLEAPGVHAYSLERPVENFLLEAHFLSPRPWGSCRIALAAAPDGSAGVTAYLCGQPNGLGLRVELECEGLPRDGTSEIWGHPQPGVEYILRLARVGDRAVLALWPLARDSPAPLEVARTLPAGQSPVRHVILDARSVDRLGELALRRLTVRDCSIPLDRVDRWLPDAVLCGVQPAWVPPLPASYDPPRGNLLAGELHPYESDAWTSIGNWAWWERAAPGATTKRVYCTPCSREQRAALKSRPSAPLYGWQLLRFDRARYGDFEATLRVKLATAADGATTANTALVSFSEDAQVGLAFRLQDTPRPGSAWGGGYLAIATLSPDESSPARVFLSAHDGCWLEPTHECAVAPLEQRPAISARVPPVDRALFFAPEGFTLTVRAVGPHFTMALNGKQVLEADDPGGFASGRIALFASRLIATFDSLEIVPLD